MTQNQVKVDLDEDDKNTESLFFVWGEENQEAPIGLLIFPICAKFQHLRKTRKQRPPR